jgi:CheY-like chemotaxis protein
MSIVLLVDDDDSLPLLLHLAIKRSGLPIELHSVCDGDEAVQYLTRKGEYKDQVRHPFPALVLLDLKMLRMNGFEVLEWKRAQPQLEEVPVVIWSSSSLQEDRERALRLGALMYFVKPMESSGFLDLLNTIESHCNVAAKPARKFGSTSRAKSNSA